MSDKCRKCGSLSDKEAAEEYCKANDLIMIPLAHAQGMLDKLTKLESIEALREQAL